MEGGGKEGQQLPRQHAVATCFLSEVPAFMEKRQHPTCNYPATLQHDEKPQEDFFFLSKFHAQCGA